MGSYTQFFGHYLKVDDLNGRAVPVRIASIAVEDVRSDHSTETKLIATFAGHTKRLILNKVNSQTIATVAGTPDIDRWPGTAVVLYPDVTSFGTKTNVPCIRIRAAAAPARPRRLPSRSPSAVMTVRRRVARTCRRTRSRSNAPEQNRRPGSHPAGGSHARVL